jgi:hypothetical protein
MIADESRIKIADFGIAKATDELQSRTALTATGTTIGTPRYMAPEQAMGQPVGPRTDLYAVGMIAFEMFAGRLPFDMSGSPMTILLRRVNETPLRLDAVDPSADPRVTDWIGRLLASEPEDRTPTAGAAWSEFEEIVLNRLGSRWRHAAGLESAATVAATPSTMAIASPTVADERPVVTAKPRTPRPAPPRRSGAHGRLLGRALLLLMSLAVLAAGALALVPGHGSRPASSATTPAAAPAAVTRQPAPNGVGDSQSDDPSDDAPDNGEP